MSASSFSIISSNLYLSLTFNTYTFHFQMFKVIRMQNWLYNYWNLLFDLVLLSGIYNCLSSFFFLNNLILSCIKYTIFLKKKTSFIERPPFFCSKMHHLLSSLAPYLSFCLSLILSLPLYFLTLSFTPLFCWAKVNSLQRYL